MDIIVLIMKGVLIIIFVFLLCFSFLIIPALAGKGGGGKGFSELKEDFSKSKGMFWKHRHIKSLARAIDPTELGGIVMSPLEITIEGITFIYTNYSDFVLVPSDGIPSMVFIFNKGSTESILYIDNDAKELLDDQKSKIEIIGVNSLKVKKSDLEKSGESELYSIKVKDNNGKRNLKNVLDNELATGSKIIYPQITSPSTNTKGSEVIIKESKDVGFFSIRSINDFMLWINLRFNMNLNNEEKEIFQEGILTTLEKAVEDCAAGVPGENIEVQQVITENTCVAVEE